VAAVLGVAEASVSVYVLK